MITPKIKSMRMLDVRMKDYNVFTARDIDPKKNAEQNNILKYIDHLASITSTDITQWPIIEMCINPDTNALYTDRKKINQIFFAAKEGQDPQAATAMTPDNELPNMISPEEYERLQISEFHYAGNRAARLRNEINSLEQVIEQREQELINRTTELLSKRDQLAGAVVNPQKSLIKQINEILQDPFWELDNDTGSDYIQLITGDVVMHYKDIPKAIDLTKNFGRFLVRLHMNPVRILVLPGDARLRGDYSQKELPEPHKMIHPHVRGSGEPCFGSILKISEKILENDVVSIFKGLKLTLLNYNPGSCYYRLDQFITQEQWNEKHNKPKPEIRLEPRGYGLTGSLMRADNDLVSQEMARRTVEYGHWIPPTPLHPRFTIPIEAPIPPPPTTTGAQNAQL